MEVRVGDDDRGREATRPSEFPSRGWKDILLRTKDQIGEDNLFIVAAGVAFSAFLALFPAIAAMASLLGLVLEPTEAARVIDAAGGLGVLPPEALAIIRDQAHEVVTTSDEALGIGLLVSVGLALWSAAAGVKALMTGLNIVYEEHESRGFLKYYATALLLTLGALMFVIVALALVAALPAVLERLLIPEFIRTGLGMLRWAILGGMLLFALALVYRFGPSRQRPQWRWVSWGAGVATLLWLGGSALFSLYVANFANYNKTYGALAAIVILLTWFYLTAIVVLLGAELNAEMEHQTRLDSTVGRPEPMGRRGARMADSLGESR